MGLTTGNFPPVDPATFTQMPYLERLKVLSRHGMGLAGAERARRAAEYQAIADYYERLLRKFRERAQETTAGTR